MVSPSPVGHDASAPQRCRGRTKLASHSYVAALPNPANQAHRGRRRCRARRDHLRGLKLQWHNLFGECLEDDPRIHQLARSYRCRIAVSRARFGPKYRAGAVLGSR